MTSLIASAALLGEEATHADTAAVPAWGFGLLGFVVLGALLVVTLMINVDR